MIMSNDNMIVLVNLAYIRENAMRANGRQIVCTAKEDTHTGEEFALIACVMLTNSSILTARGRSTTGCGLKIVLMEKVKLTRVLSPILFVHNSMSGRLIDGNNVYEMSYQNGTVDTCSILLFL